MDYKFIWTNHIEFSDIQIKYNLELCKGIKLSINKLFDLGLKFIKTASSIFADKKSEPFFYSSIILV